MLKPKDSNLLLRGKYQVVSNRSNRLSIFRNSLIRYLHNILGLWYFWFGSININQYQNICLMIWNFNLMASGWWSEHFLEIYFVKLLVKQKVTSSIKETKFIRNHKSNWHPNSKILLSPISFTFTYFFFFMKCFFLFIFVLTFDDNRYVIKKKAILFIFLENLLFQLATSPQHV